MRCLICDNDHWENVDRYRLKQFEDQARTKPIGMEMCTFCGFISYPKKYKTEEEIKAYYRKDYRPRPPMANNLFTSERKLGYHEVFLKDTLEKWQKEKKEDPTIVDVGAALGLVPCWLKAAFPKGDIYGVELTQSFRRVAWHEFGVETLEDIKDKKHDLIVSYKVAEHQLDVDKKLRDYVLALKDDGLMYISVPVWFKGLTNFGVGGFDLEYYYSPDHINVWTENHFEYLLAKVGLEIVKSDMIQYENTYLCKRNDSLMKKTLKDFDVPSPETIKENLDKVKKAAMAFNLKNFEEALQHWPNFPSAWISLYKQSRQKIDQAGGLEPAGTFFREALESTKGNLDVALSWGDVQMQYGKYEDAIKTFRMVRALRPRTPGPFIAEANCLRLIAREEEDPNRKYQLLTESRELMRTLKMVHTQTIAESLNWSYADSAKIPTPSESKEVPNG